MAATVYVTLLTENIYCKAGSSALALCFLSLQLTFNFKRFCKSARRQDRDLIKHKLFSSEVGLFWPYMLQIFKFHNCNQDMNSSVVEGRNVIGEFRVRILCGAYFVGLF